MRLTIRDEQIAVVEAVAEENFVNRLAAHLLAEYPGAEVTLPDGEKFSLAALPAETLYELVRVGIARARRYGMTFESAISAFAAVMFEISPNFDTHRLCQVLFNDEEVEPNGRLDEVLDVLTEKNWESIRADYDPQAWKPEPVKDAGATPETIETKSNSNEPGNTDFQETVKI